MSSTIIDDLLEDGVDQTGELFARRFTIVMALAKGRDPYEVGVMAGILRRAVTRTLQSLRNMGLVEAEKVPPAPNAPAYIKHRNKYTLTYHGARLVSLLSGMPVGDTSDG